MSKKTTSSRLSTVPALFRVDTELPSGETAFAGHTRWVPIADAQFCEQHRFAVICIAVSVLKQAVLPNGRVLHPESQIVTLDVGFAPALEALEREGGVKILRTDREVEIHKAAWSDQVEQWKAAIARGRQMLRDAQEFSKKAGRLTPPVIDWNTPVTEGAEAG